MLCFSRTCVVLTMTAVCMLRILFTCSFSGTSPFCLEPTPLGYREERLWCWRHGQTRVCPATRVSLQDRSQVQEVLPSTYEIDCESCVRYCSFDRSSVLHHTPVLSRGGAVIFQGSVARALHPLCPHRLRAVQQPLFSSCQFSFECMWLDSEALYDNCFHNSGPS